MKSDQEYYVDLDREYNGSLLETEGDNKANFAYGHFGGHDSLSVLSNGWQTIDLVESVVLP